MINIGKCPKCNNLVTTVKIEAVQIIEGFLPSEWGGLSFLCPTCHCVLGVEIDPVGVSGELLKNILAALHP